jgi:hypothetical protein
MLCQFPVVIHLVRLNDNQVCHLQFPQQQVVVVTR